MTAPPALSTTELGTSGPRLVLLHGLFGQGKNWTAVAKELAADCRVTLVDLPDHGRSGRTDRFSYADNAALIAELVRGLGDGPVTVVGHSMGGKTAMSLALRHPELVARLVVADIAPVRYAGLRDFATFVTGMRSLDLGTLPDRAAADEQLQPYVADPVVRSFLLQNLRRGPDRTGAGSWHWQLNLRLLGDELDAIGDWPDLAAPPYPGPVLWLAGGRSDYIRPEYDPAMRALFPRTQLVTIKNAGHWVHAEAPAVFVAAVRRFVHPGPRGAENTRTA